MQPSVSCNPLPDEIILQILSFLHPHTTLHLCEQSASPILRKLAFHALRALSVLTLPRDASKCISSFQANSHPLLQSCPNISKIVLQPFGHMRLKRTSVSSLLHNSLRVSSLRELCVGGLSLHPDCIPHLLENHPSISSLTLQGRRTVTPKVLLALVEHLVIHRVEVGSQLLQKLHIQTCNFDAEHLLQPMIATSVAKHLSFSEFSNVLVLKPILPQSFSRNETPRDESYMRICNFKLLRNLHWQLPSSSNFPRKLTLSHCPLLESIQLNHMPQSTSFHPEEEFKQVGMESLVIKHCPLLKNISSPVSGNGWPPGVLFRSLRNLRLHRISNPRAKECLPPLFLGAAFGLVEEPVLSPLPALRYLDVSCNSFSDLFVVQIEQLRELRARDVFAKAVVIGQCEMLKFVEFSTSFWSEVERVDISVTKECKVVGVDENDSLVWEEKGSNVALSKKNLSWRDSLIHVILFYDVVFRYFCTVWHFSIASKQLPPRGNFHNGLFHNAIR